MVIIGLTLTILFGWSIIRLLKLPFTWKTQLSLSYLLGIGIQTLVMFYMAVIGIKLTLSSVFLLSMATTILIIIAKRPTFKLDTLVIKTRQLLHIKKISQLKVVEKISLLVFVCLAVYVLLTGLYWPVYGWDSIALYDFRSKIFTETGFMDEAIKRGYFFGYPLMTSMAHAWIYLLGWLYPKFLYSLMYLSMGVIFYELLQEWTDKITAYIFTFLLLISPPIFSHATFDYTNLPYTVYFFTSSIMMVLGIKNKNYKLFILSALLMGIATWVRSTDPFWVVNVVVLLIAMLIKLKSIKPLFYYLLFFIPIQQSWSLYISKMAPHVSTGALIEQSIKVASQDFDIMHFVEVVIFVLSVVAPTLFLYFILLLLSIVVDRKSILKKSYLYLTILGNTLLLFVGAYIFSFIFPGWGEIGESLGRMIYIFIPLYLFVSATNLRLGKILKIDL